MASSAGLLTWLHGLPAFPVSRWHNGFAPPYSDGIVGDLHPASLYTNIQSSPLQSLRPDFRRSSLKFLRIRKYSLRTSPRLSKIIHANLCMALIKNTYHRSAVLDYRDSIQTKARLVKSRCAKLTVGVVIKGNPSVSYAASPLWGEVPRRGREGDGIDRA